MKCLYEDNHLLVAQKPAGLLTQSTEREVDSLEEQARQYIKESRNKPGGVFLHAVHRLDKAVSGIVVFGLSKKALSRMNDKSSWTKEYLAIVSSELAINKGPVLLEHLHRKADHRATVSPISDQNVSKGLKPVRLEYTVLAIDKTRDRSLLQVKLLTGRYHQIRAQLAYAIAPIVNDKRYGYEAKVLEQIGLHHFRLSFEHPTTKEILRFRCSPNYVPKNLWKPFATPISKLKD